MDSIGGRLHASEQHVGLWGGCTHWLFTLLGMAKPWHQVAAAAEL
jgi:hypothetical protein